MALPKLRRFRSPGPLRDDGPRNGGSAQAGSDVRPADQDRERPAEPQVWVGPAEEAPDAAAPGPEAAGCGPIAEASDDMSIWDWAPAETADPRLDYREENEFTAGFRDYGTEPAESIYPPPEPEPEPAASSPQRASAAGPAGPAGETARPAGETARPAGETAGPAGPAAARPGIGQRRGNLAHLSADPRMRGWRIRALIAVAVAVVFWIWVSWQLGLTLAIIAAIADTIYRSRTRYDGRAGGGKLTGAQKRTRRQLNKLGRAGYRAMHANPIPGSDEQIDHLVVGPAGVFAIDSEAWDRRLVVRTRNARELYHGPFSMKHRLDHARWEAQRAAEVLTSATGTEVSVRPAMAVYGPPIRWDVATISDVDVFSGPRLRKYLQRRARQSGVRRLTEAEVERLYQAAARAFPHLNSGTAVG